MDLSIYLFRYAFRHPNKTAANHQISITHLSPRGTRLVFSPEHGLFGELTPRPDGSVWRNKRISSKDKGQDGAVCPHDLMESTGTQSGTGKQLVPLLYRVIPVLGLSVKSRGSTPEWGTCLIHSYELGEPFRISRYLWTHDALDESKDVFVQV